MSLEDDGFRAPNHVDAPSRARRRIAAVERPEQVRSHHANEQNADTHGGDLIRRMQIETSYAGDE